MLYDYSAELIEAVESKIDDSEVIDNEWDDDEGGRELIQMNIPNDETLLFYHTYGNGEQYLGLVTTDFWGKTLKEYDEEEPSTFELPELRTAELWSYLTPEEQTSFKAEYELTPLEVLNLENIEITHIENNVVSISRKESMYTDNATKYTIKSANDVKEVYIGEDKKRLYSDIVAGAKYILDENK